MNKGANSKDIGFLGDYLRCYLCGQFLNYRDENKRHYYIEHPFSYWSYDPPEVEPVCYKCYIGEAKD